MFIGLCSNQTEEVDPIEIYDPEAIDPGWGFLKDNEETCHSNEEIKDFLEIYKPIF